MADRDYLRIYSGFIQLEEQNQNMKQLRKTLQKYCNEVQFLYCSFRLVVEAIRYSPLDFRAGCVSVCGAEGVFFMASQYIVN